MKLTLLSLIALATLCCSSNSERSYSEKKIKPFVKCPPSVSMLDSLQGKWVNDDDTANKIQINNREVYQKYSDTNIFILTSRIYFTETPFSVDDTLLPVIDTSLKSGTYIVFSSYPNNHFECYEFNGFYLDNTDTSFSFQPVKYFKAKSVLSFTKVH